MYFAGTAVHQDSQLVILAECLLFTQLTANVRWSATIIVIIIIVVVTIIILLRNLLCF